MKSNSRKDHIVTQRYVRRRNMRTGLLLSYGVVIHLYTARRPNFALGVVTLWYLGAPFGVVFTRRRCITLCSLQLISILST
jgi:hypothetical protein